MVYNDLLLAHLTELTELLKIINNTFFLLVDIDRIQVIKCLFLRSTFIKPLFLIFEFIPILDPHSHCFILLLIVTFLDP